MKRLLHSVHHRYVRPHPIRTRVGLSSLALALLFMFLNWLATAFVHPNTYVASINVGGKTPDELVQLLNDQAQKQFTLKIKYRIYGFSHETLGVTTDTPLIMDKILLPNRKVFPMNLASLVFSLFTKRTVIPTFTFTADFYRFVDDTIIDFTSQPDQVEVDPGKNFSPLSRILTVL